MVYWNPVATCPAEAGVDLLACLLASSDLGEEKEEECERSPNGRQEKLPAWHIH